MEMISTSNVRVSNMAERLLSEAYTETERICVKQKLFKLTGRCMG